MVEVKALTNNMTSHFFEVKKPSDQTVAYPLRASSWRLVAERQCIARLTKSVVQSDVLLIFVRLAKLVQSKGSASHMRIVDSLPSP
jgi:hypothetical protein